KFRVDELPASIKCELGCPNDCGLTAVCVAREGGSQCVCPDSQIYSAADKQCHATCSPPCRQGATCQVENGVAMCKCGAGYTMMGNGQCKAICQPACATKSECVVVGGNSVCQCKQGYVLKGTRCMPQAGVGQAREWLNHQIR
ncbi:unnamed protein product, partial [Closterium sp. Naga37s-1]